MTMKDVPLIKLPCENMGIFRIFVESLFAYLHLYKFSSISVLDKIEHKKWWNENLQANTYFFKVNNRNIKKRCETCSKLIVKATEQHQ